MAGLVIYKGTEPATVQLAGEGTLSVSPGLAYEVSLANAAKLIASNPNMWEAGNAETKAFVPGVSSGGVTFNVFGYGAKGDGVTDDTEAFARGIAAVKAAGGGILSVPVGKYVVSQITIETAGGDAPVILDGAGTQATEIIKGTAGNAPVIVIKTTTAGEFVSRSMVRHMSVFGKNKESAGVYLERVAWGEVNDVAVYNCSVGIEGRGIISYGINNCIVFNNCTKGIVLTRSTAVSTVGSNSVAIRRCITSNCKSIGIEADYCPGLVLERCDIENNGEKGKPATGGILIGPHVTTEFGAGVITVSGCWIEENNGRAITCESGELVVNNGTMVFATDTTTLTTNGRDLLVAGTTSTLKVDACSFPSTIPENRSSIEVTATACIGTIADTLTARVEKSAAAGVVVRRGLELGAQNILTLNKAFAASEAPIFSLYIDSADTKLHWKDGSGVSHLLTASPIQ